MRPSLWPTFALITSTLALSTQHPGIDHATRLQARSQDESRPHLKPRVAEKAGGHTYEQLYGLQIKFLDAFIYPNNQKEAKAINSTIFAENVQGRVDITRTFNGRELNTEYIFGLFANLAESSDFTLLGYPTSYEIVEFAASGNVASASTRFQFEFPALKETVPVIINTYNAFNAAGEITMYDAVFKYWTYAFDNFLMALASPSSSSSASNPASSEQSNPQIQYNDTTQSPPSAQPPQLNPVTLVSLSKKLISQLATSICKTHETYCAANPATKQYNTQQACLSYLTDPTKVRLGKSYELGMNTVLCRMVHMGMVALRPEVHCPHIGPSGGGMCVDAGMSYAEVVGVASGSPASGGYFTNQPFVDVPIGRNTTGGNSSGRQVGTGSVAPGNDERQGLSNSTTQSHVSGDEYENPENL